MSVVNIKGPNLFEHQKAVVKTLDSMMPGGTLVVKSARQRGKSLLLMNMLLRQSINFANTTSILVEPAWNAGLTKETDERVAKYGETHSENNKNKCQ